MRWMVIFFLFSSIGYWFALYSRNEVYYYEPTEVFLSGIPVEKTFPGPPNYEDITTGDDPETGWYLEMKRMIDVTTKDRTLDSNNDQMNVDTIQLVIDWHSPIIEKKKYLLKKGGMIQVKGTLFSAGTGHHHARVLLNLEDLF